MKREKVSSSSIATIGYDPVSKTLEVEFNHGGIYRYMDVPFRKYEELKNAVSIGNYFDRHIRDAGYPYVKVG
jgi:hypothetical protein